MLYGRTLAAVLCLICLSCCGGGTTNTNTAPASASPPASSATPDFSIIVSPEEITVPPGLSQTIAVSIQSINGFTGEVNVSLTGVPSGVSTSSSSFNLSVGQEQTVTFSASSQAPYAVGTLMLQGTSGSSSHTSQVLLAVSQIAPTALHAPMRTRYIRTDASYTYDLQYAPPHLVVYSPAQKRFFVSNPYLNRIDVFDATQEIEIAQITVPGAWGLDLSPDGTTIYVGTLIGDIYEVDPVGMDVVQRIPSSTIGPNGYSATEAFVLANGSLALLGSPGGLSVDGYQGFAIWNPADNSLVEPGSCVQNIGPFAVSGDRTRVLLSTIDEGGGGETVCSYDPVAGEFTTGVFPPATPVRQIIPTPDGQRFFLTSNVDGVAVFDAHSVQLLGQITGPSSYALPSGSLGAVLSLDGSTLYLADGTMGAMAGFDTTSLSQTSWVPGFVTQNDGLMVPMISAIDETGLMIGPIGHGVAFVDASQAVSAQNNVLGFGNVTPATGPAGGGTNISAQILSLLLGFSNVNSTLVSQIFVGSGSATNLGYADLPPAAEQFTSPASTLPGAADITATLSGGGLGIAPENFSYGPTVVEVSTSAASADGGAEGVLFGYGLGQTTSDLQVSISGQSVPVTQLLTSPPSTPYPFPTETALFTIPAGTAGTSADVTVTTSGGSATVQGGLNYIPALQNYSRPGVSLEEGIYDTHRSVLYFTDSAQIQRFSPSTQQWLTPIAIPNAARLWALALSPDGSQLAISDSGGAQIFLLNPDNPASVQSFPVQTSAFDVSAGIEPCGLAVSDAGVIYFATFETGGDGAPAFHELDTSTGAIIDLGTIVDVGNVFVSPDAFIRVRMTPDGSHVYLNESDDTYVLNTSTNSVSFGPDVAFGEGPNELDLSGDGTRLITGGYLADAGLNPIAAVSYVDRDTWVPSAVYGQKLNSDGSLLFQPLTNGLDVINGNTGLLINRIALSIQAADVYDAMAIDDTDNLLFVITAGGIVQIDPYSLPAVQSLLRTAPSQREYLLAAPPGNASHSQVGAHSVLRVPNQLRRNTAASQSGR